MEAFIQTPHLFDLALVAVVLIFAILGARRGLILSFCSFVAVILAFWGATAAADYLAPPLAVQAAPAVEGFLSGHLEAWLRSGSAALEQADGFLPHVVLTVLEGRDWSAQADTLLPAVTLVVTEEILHAVIFFLTFVLILILWYVISHTLDLLARLPVLSTLNMAGGFLFGLTKGILLLVVVYLAIQIFAPHLIPASLVEGSLILPYLQKVPVFSN